MLYVCVWERQGAHCASVTTNLKPTDDSTDTNKKTTSRRAWWMSLWFLSFNPSFIWLKKNWGAKQSPGHSQQRQKSPILALTLKALSFFLLVVWFSLRVNLSYVAMQSVWPCLNNMQLYPVPAPWSAYTHLVHAAVRRLGVPAILSARHFAAEILRKRFSQCCGML